MDVSVVVPIYNVESYLKECLDSILANVEPLDAEVLLVDDGSTDGSPAIAQAFADEHPQFVYLRKENGGLSDARNFGVAHAQGEYLLFVDSDDLLMPGILPQMLKTARAQGTDLTVCSAARFDGKTCTASGLHNAAFNNLEANVTHIRETPSLVYDSSVWNKLIRRSFYDASGITFPVGYLYEDYLTMLPLHYYAKSVAVVRSIGYLWRKRGGKDRSITQQPTELRNLTDKIEMSRQLYQWMNRERVEPEVRLEREVRTLSTDFFAYLTSLDELEPDEATNRLDLLASFIEECISPEAFERAALKARATMAAVMERNPTRVTQLCNYFATDYAAAPVRQEDNKLMVTVPAWLFGREEEDFSRDATPCTVLTRVDAMRGEGRHLIIDGHAYVRRVATLMGEQTASAYLINETTGARADLPCTLRACPSLTRSQGTVLSHEDYLVHHYDYDGTGFSIDVDLDALDEVDGIEGTNLVMVEFEAPFYNGRRVLRGAGDKTKAAAKKAKLDDGRYKVSIGWDSLNTMQLCVEAQEQ